MRVKVLFTLYCLTIWLGFWLIPAYAQQPTIVRVPDYLEQSPHRPLLEYALTITAPEYGEVELAFATAMVQGRAEQSLLAGDALHLAVFAPSPERESALLPVYFPLNGGLLGYRVCLIAEGQQSKFDAIATAEDWRKAELIFGQGAHWPDVAILRSNNLQVVTNPKYELLFDMARSHRFDCFARSIEEVEYDKASVNAQGLMIEQQVLFYYPQASFFFVSPRYPQLAERLQKGLEQAAKNRVIQQHFETYFGTIVQQIRCQNRRLIRLDNPLLSPKVVLALQQFAYAPEILLRYDASLCQPQAK